MHFLSEEFWSILTSNWWVVVYSCFHPINCPAHDVTNFIDSDWFRQLFAHFLIWNYSYLNLYNSRTRRDIKIKIRSRHPFKIRSRHPRDLKLTGLIAYIMFYKICRFGSSPITNDVIMTSLPKTMAKFGPPRNQKNYTGCPNKNATFFTKHVATACCLIAKILFDSERVCIYLNSDTLASPICKIFFAIHKAKDSNIFSKS